MNWKATTLGLALAGSTLGSATAQADDCFILVHGHNPDGTNLVEAEEYWHNTFIPLRSAGNFLDELTDAGANYGITGWNASNDDHVPYWHPDAAGTVAEQIVDITSGLGDGQTNHNSSQCSANDTFYVIAHSQGSQVMTFISGNSYASAPYQDEAIDEMLLSGIDGSENTVAAPFTAAMNKIEKIYTLTGAVNGTEGMDDTCDGGLDGFLVELFKDCVESMQTYDEFNPSSFTGGTLQTPVYAIGGYRAFPFPFSATSVILNGEDDGVVNLASQMNCEGSPKRDLEKDFTERKWWGGINFRCDDDHKRHSGHYNLASIKTDHDSVRNATFSSPAHVSYAQDVPGCGDDENAANTVLECLGY